MNRIIKKSFIVGMLCFLIAGFLNPLAVSAISKDGVYMEKMLKNYKNGKYKAAEKNAKKLHKNANEKCVKNMPKKMKQVYKKIAKAYEHKAILVDGNYVQNPEFAYYLTDIDNDNKADLIVEYGSYSNWMVDVYQYKNDSIKEIGTVSLGMYPYFHSFPDHNGVVMSAGRGGYEQISVISISNGKLKERKYGDRGVRETNIPYLSIGCVLDSHIEYDENYNSHKNYSDLK